MRPVLRYHGGKFRLAPKIVALFPPHRIYTEAFGGAASVLMRKARSYAEVYNDRDDEIVNVFRVMQSPAKARRLRELLELTPFARSEFLKSYKPTHVDVERARRTIIKAFMGFGSSSIYDKRAGTMLTRASQWKAPTGFRSNSHRSGTTPAHDWKHYPPQVTAFCERLQGVVIENRPAVEVIAGHDKEDCLHYVDPPYPMQTRKDPGKDYRFEMSDTEHGQLAEVLHAVKGMVVISSYPGELYEGLYRDWFTVDWTSGHFCDGAQRRTEVVWMNKAAYEMSGQKRLAYA